MQRYLFSGLSLKNKRPSNMDSLLLKCKTIEGRATILTAVCDGVGSFADGAFASGTAVRMLNGWFEQVKCTDRIGLRLRDAVLDIHTQIAAQAKEHGFQTAATLSALLLADGMYYIVHIGDSRIYMYYDETLSILTKDDISENGKLTACIGRSGRILLQYSEGCAEGKAFLVCSDGLYKRLTNDFITKKMQVSNKRMVKAAVKALAHHAIEQGEQDNISLALIKIKISACR